MKTTIEIPDDLLKQAKAVATAEHVTLRSLLVEGLRHVLSRRKKGAGRFVLRDAAVAGRGPREGVEEGDWERMRDRIYDRRGG